jgi:hypothetical protein
MNSGSAQKPGSIGTGYKPGIQAWYNQFLVVDPASADHVYAGLEEVYESTDAGRTWTTAAPYWNLTLKCFDLQAPDFGGCPNTTHSDQHAAAIANGTLWVGNDGGVFSRPTSAHTAGGPTTTGTWGRCSITTPTQGRNRPRARRCSGAVSKTTGPRS